MIDIKKPDKSYSDVVINIEEDWSDEITTQRVPQTSTPFSSSHEIRFSFAHQQSDEVINIEEDWSYIVNSQNFLQTSTPFSSSTGSDFSSADQQSDRTSTDVVINIEQEENRDDQCRSDEQTTRSNIDLLSSLAGIFGFSILFVIVFLAF